MGTQIRYKLGFTIVELAVVISVIGILASITIVGYGAWQTRTAESVIKSDLSNVASAMESARNFSNGYPASFPSTFTPSANVVLQMTSAPAGTFCINAYHLKNTAAQWSYNSSKKKVQAGYCAAAVTGSPIGGAVPAVPLNTNLVADFSEWTLSGGISYDASAKELVFSSSGTAASPLVRVNGANNARLTVESYATTAAPQAACTPNSCVYFSSAYYTADGTTPATSSAGWTGNGNAQMTPLSSWQTRTWTTATGPSVIYMRFIVNSDPASYTSNNRIRNPVIVTPN